MKERSLFRLSRIKSLRAGPFQVIVWGALVLRALTDPRKTSPLVVKLPGRLVDELAAFEKVRVVSPKDSSGWPSGIP
jgi:hypothetical protein